MHRRRKAGREDGAYAETFYEEASYGGETYESEIDTDSREEGEGIQEKDDYQEDGDYQSEDYQE